MEKIRVVCFVGDAVLQFLHFAFIIHAEKKPKVDIRHLNTVIIVVLVDYDGRILTVTQGLEVTYWAL